MIRKMLFALNLRSDQWLALRNFLFPDADCRYYCASCDTDFPSYVTPVKCPLCAAAAEEQPQAILLTHKSHAAKTFPFFSPDT